MAMSDYSDVDYFEEASSSIEVVQHAASHQVQVNLFQCQYLSSKLAETGSFLKAKSDTLKAIHDLDDMRRKALLKLHFTVKRAEKLVRSCCCEMESWLESAVTVAQIKEDIVDILLDLRMSNTTEVLRSGQDCADFEAALLLLHRPISLCLATPN